jgi:hypothetical protein
MVEGDIFREVDEELKREQYAKLWDQYGYLVIGAALAIVVAVAGYKYWKTQQMEQAATFGARYVEALGVADGKDRAKAEAALKQIAAVAPRGYAMLAQLRGASLAASDGGTDDAVAAYDAMAKDGGVEPTLRDFARVQAAALRLDKADLAEMKERLGALAEADGSWRHSARELLGLAAFKAGELGEAEQWYNRISEDPQAPASMKQRAEMMVSLIFEANQDKPIAPAPAPGSAKEGAKPGAAAAPAPAPAPAPAAAGKAKGN